MTAEFAPPMVHGALAAQMQPAVRIVAQAAAPSELRMEQGHTSRPSQAQLFQDRVSNVIPIASYAPPRAETKPPTRVEDPAKPVTQKPVVKRAKPVAEGQGSLDFLPPAPAKPRRLGTTVEAVIYCEAPVATTLHRAVAAALDWSMVLIAYGMFLTAFYLLGGEFELTKSNVSVFGAMFLLIGFTYGLLFSLAGAETAGMHWTQLRLTTFDGFAPERRQRLVRFGAASLARCTLLGILWSLADEESLAWQDHISRTFPTPCELDQMVFRRR